LTGFLVRRRQKVIRNPAQRVDGKPRPGLPQEMRTVGSAVSAGERPPIALAIVCDVAELREGSEVVPFLFGIAQC
jgi:hypothetical protein